jgi:hypothetical protein
MSLLLDLGLALAPLVLGDAVHHLGHVVAAAYPGDAIYSYVPSAWFNRKVGMYRKE